MKKLLALLFLSFSVWAVSAVGKQKNRESETEKFDEALDENYHSESYYVLEGKFLRVELFARTGTFNIYCRTREGKDVPLLSAADLFSSSGFVMKVDGVRQPLVNSLRVKKELRRLENGAQLVYRLENRIRLVVDFLLIASREDKPEDIVQVRLFALNEGKSPHDIEIRGIFDTVCGEIASVHFTTANNSKVRNELRFSHADMQRERAVISSNGTVSFQFVLDGIDITPVDSVTFANIDELHKMDWDSGLRKGRGFSTIRGYDDSGMMIGWPQFTLPVNERHDLVFYIAAADNEETPRGLLYADRILYAPVEPEEPGEEEKPPVENPDKRTDVEFIVPPIKDYQLDPEYIQNLIDRIDSLQSSKDVNKKEIQRLNAELDAILEKLRRQ